LALSAAGLPPVIWSAADEPSNPDLPPDDAKNWVDAIRRADPSARLGGQFNSPSDARFLPLFNVALINTGYGIDQATIGDIRRKGLEVWVYNTARPRLTAGDWLWVTEASRYLQWHARMPTADPFDPTDGREGDFQIFWPTPKVCPSVPDVHPDLLAMAEGITDLRWLTWLDGRTDPAARALAKRLRSSIGPHFKDALTLTDQDLVKMREEIVSLARKPR
jgi:hypothetical protein